MTRKPIIITDDRCEVRDNAMTNILINLGIIVPKQHKENVRGQRANYMWQPFIDDEGNGCCTNILTGETYLDWTKEELEEE